MLELPDDDIAALEAALGLAHTRAPPSPAPLHTEVPAEGERPGSAQATWLRSSSVVHDLLQDQDTEPAAELEQLVAGTLSPLAFSASNVGEGIATASALTVQPGSYPSFIPDPVPLESKPSAREAAEPTQTPGRQQFPTQMQAAKNPRKLRSAKVNTNRSRNERKHELAYLRAKVKTLERDLKSLHRRHSAKITQPPTSITGSDTPPLRSMCTPPAMPNEHETLASELPRVWEDIAVRQLEHREKAERENARLKLVLEGQIKLAKSMERLLQKRAKQQMQDCAGCVHQSNRLVQGRALDILADKATYEALLAGVESAYSEMDTVFAVNGLDSIETPGRDARMREGPNGMYLDVLSTKLLPFDLKSTGRAVWNHFKGSEKHRGNLYQKAAKNLEEVSDTVLEDFIMDGTGGRMSSHFRVKQIVRHYVEADREVVLTISIVQLLGQSDERPFSTTDFTEKSYVVIKRPTSPALLQGDFSVLQMCSLVVPQQTEFPALDAPAAGTFTEFVLDVIAANITMNEKLIENVLLDQAVQHQRTEALDS